MGVDLKRAYKQTLRCFVKTIFRCGLQNFQHLVSQSVQKATEVLVERLNMAGKLVFQKSDG
jgi:hypothetical protein